MKHDRSTFGRVFRRKWKGEYTPGFYVRVRLHGKEITRWGGPDRKTARELLADMLRKSAREDLFGERHVAPTSFEALKPNLLRYFEARHGETTVKGERGRVDRIVEHFGVRPLGEIKPSDVTDFLSLLRTDARYGCKPATVNRYAACLSVAFDYAVERGFARTNPVDGFERHKEPKRAVPFLSSADVDRIVGLMPEPRLRALVRIFADAGLRRSEAVALEWRDVNLARGVVLVRRSKNHEPREVPLTAAALAALQEMHDARGAVPMKGPDPVWPEYGETRQKDHVSRLVARRMRAAGFVGLRLHDLRHGFCSRLAQAGVPIPTIAALAGHKSIATTMRYAGHLPTNATEAAIRRLEAASRAAISEVEGDRTGDSAKGASATSRAGVA